MNYHNKIKFVLRERLHYVAPKEQPPGNSQAKGPWTC